ncbi:MAG TPA: energy transducer TonB [Chthoniobacterales bacterium]|nr:energy transducer TonB [Chthoniobacterales bacterium]
MKIARLHLRKIGASVALTLLASGTAGAAQQSKTTPAPPQSKPTLVAPQLKPDPAALLRKAEQLSDIRKAGSAFHLQAKVTLFGAGDQHVDGTLNLWWISATKWREELRLPGYVRVRVGGDHKYWVQRNAPFEISIVERIDELVNIAARLLVRSDEHIGDPRRKTENGTARDCVDITRNPTDSRALCFDAASGALVLDERSQPGLPPIIQSIETSRIEYADYQAWQGHLYPHAATAYSGTAEAIQVHVDLLGPVNITDLKAFDPPSGAQEWDVCDAPQPPVPLQRTQPAYPDSAKTNGEMGIVQVYVEIETDGSLSHMAVVTPPRAEFDKPTLDAMAKWRYKPAMCNGTPQRMHTTITTAYGLP